MLYGRAVHVRPGLPSGCGPGRQSAGRAYDLRLRDLDSSDAFSVVFTVDLFNEGVDVPNVDTLLMLRPTDSPTLFLQQLGRVASKTRTLWEDRLCTVLDFVGKHRTRVPLRSTTFARCCSAAADVGRRTSGSPTTFPFLASRTATLSSMPVARGDRASKHPRRDSHPTGWHDRCNELRSLGDVTRRRPTSSRRVSDLEDVYARQSQLDASSVVSLGLPVQPPAQPARRDRSFRGRTVLLHVDDRRAAASRTCPLTANRMPALPHRSN